MSCVSILNVKFNASQLRWWTFSLTGAILASGPRYLTDKDSPLMLDINLSATSLVITMIVTSTLGCTTDRSDVTPHASTADAGAREPDAAETPIEASDMRDEVFDSGAVTCVGLFGRPNENTGVDDTLCSPTCGCTRSERPWTPPEYSPELIDSLRQWELAEAPTLLGKDPYREPDAAPSRAGYCGVIDLGDMKYRLETFEDESTAIAAGAKITHAGACAACSTLADLATYIEHPDLTEPVRQCGVDTISTGVDANITCLEELGFTRACAEIWAYNTQNTRAECLVDCVRLLGDPYLTEDGQLNACLACDEQKSGPIFKAYAGRTRRNSGLPTAICRPCDGVYPAEHHRY